MNKNNKGFTLIELMVAVGIIAVMTAVLSANFSDARAQSRDKARMTSLKELQLSVELYKAQHSSNPLVFLNDRAFSSMFYSGGKALNANSMSAINRLSEKSPVYIAVKQSQLGLWNNQFDHFKMIGDGGSYRLYLK